MWDAHHGKKDDFKVVAIAFRSTREETPQFPQKRRVSSVPLWIQRLTNNGKMIVLSLRTKLVVFWRQVITQKWCVQNQKAWNLVNCNVSASSNFVKPLVILGGFTIFTGVFGQLTAHHCSTRFCGSLGNVNAQDWNTKNPQNSKKKSEWLALGISIPRIFCRLS